MKRALICVLAAIALAGCKPAAPPKPNQSDAQTLQIEIGRYGVMLGQTAALTAGKPGTGAGDPTEAKELARALRETVWTYNVQRSQLCARNLYADVSCGPALDPVWLTEPVETPPTLIELRQRSREVGEAVQKFWSAVCDDAKRAQTDPAQRGVICVME